MFFKKKKYEKVSNDIYQKIVNFSRNKIFYTKYSVPDTIDGRFDMLVLITIIIVHTKISCTRFYNNLVVTRTRS